MNFNPEYLIAKFGLDRPKPPRLFRYGLAIVLTSILLIVQYYFRDYLPTVFLDIFIAIIIVAWFGGLGPGLLATFFAAICITYFMVPLQGSHDVAGFSRLFVFIGEGTLMSILCELNQQRDNALRRNTALYQNLLRGQSDLGEGVILIENDRVAYVNEAVERITGYSWSELATLEKVIQQVVPEQQAALQELVQKRLEGESLSELYETTMYHRDGHRLQVEVSIKMVRIAKHIHLIILIRDITQRKAFEETLRRSEEHYRLLIENVSDYAIFSLKKNGEIASWNEAAERILGYDEEEIVGEDFSIVFSEENREKGLPQEQLALAEKEGRAAEQSWHVRKDGSLFFASGVITPLWNEKGKLRGYIKVIQDITEQKENEDKMKHQALHDALTDLPNRVLFCDRVDRAVASAERKNKQVAVVFLDLDKFKNINDSLGHTLGDELLQAVAGRLKKSIRKDDTVARFGGDEFTLLLPDISSIEDCTKLVKKIFKTLRPAFNINGRELHINTSMGISLYPDHGKDVQTLLKNADTALYKAKGEGRNNYQVYAAEMNLQADKDLILENELRQALDRGEFVLYYQPIIEASTGRIVAAEALVRWIHPRVGFMGPTEFIPLAEESGIIVPLNEWVLKTACRQSRQWQLKGLPPIILSVNISVRQFLQKNLTDKISTIIQETEMPPEMLELEVTESFAMHSITDTTQRLKKLRQLGVKIAIDDFGTGHSSLNYLKHLPINTLKIDRSFISGCVQSRQDAEIVKAITVIGHSLDLRVVAEGVETSSQLKYIRSLDCDFIQGFLFSEPVSAEKFTELLHRNAKQKGATRAPVLQQIE